MPSTRRPPGDRPVRASVHTYRVAPASAPARRSFSGGPRPPSPPGASRPVLGRRGRRTWRQRGVLVLGSVVATTCLLGAAVVGYGWARWRSVDRVGLDTDAAPAGEPVNFLLVGSDSRAREGAAEQEAVEGQRTDTIMVLRLDPAAEEVSVLSFPRDLWVPIAGRDESARINTAYDAPGRQQVLVDTIREDFGIEINHWIEVDFEGFRQLVDALGGVTLYFDRALRDRGSGLYVEQLGCVTLDGDAALAYARSRKAEYHTEDGWVRDPQSDLSRIVRQQTLMTEALHTALAEADDPVRLNELVDIAAANVTIDDELTLGDVRELADRLGSLDDDALRTVSLPVLPRPGDEGSTLVVDEEAAAPVVAEFRGGEPADLSPADIDVTVLNGTVADPARQRQGLAGDVTAGLEQVGFATSPPGDAGEVYETTVVRYASGQLTSGQRVAQHLTGGVALEEDRSLAPGEVTVVAGVDFTTVHEEPTPLDRLPAPPSDATTERGDGTEDPGAGTAVDTTTAAQPTTTSPALVGAVPDGAC